MNSLQDYSITSLLPNSLKSDPFVVALGEAVEIELKEAYREAENMANLNDVDKLPEQLVDYLAYQKHVDFYEHTLSIDQKRKLIKNATQVHRKKGTPFAIEKVLESLRLPGEVLEWFQYVGNPYYFRVEIEAVELTSETLKLLNMLIDEYKNKRSWLDYIAIKMKQSDFLHLKHFAYQYPIYYHKCGELVTAPIHGMGIGSVVGVSDMQYRYPIYYNPADAFNTDGMPGGFTVESAQIKQTSAGMRMMAPVCGVFTSGGGF